MIRRCRHWRKLSDNALRGVTAGSFPAPRRHCTLGAGYRGPMGSHLAATFTSEGISAGFNASLRPAPPMPGWRSQDVTYSQIDGAAGIFA